MNLLCQISNAELSVTAVLTGLGLVFAALLIAKLISPKSFSVRKAEPYECGIPTRGDSIWCALYGSAEPLHGYRHR